MIYSTRRFVLSLALCYFVLVFFSPFSIAITSLREERANIGVFRTFDRFPVVWFCLFSRPLRVWDGLQLVIVALRGLFSYLFCRVMPDCDCVGRIFLSSSHTHDRFFFSHTFHF